MPSKTLSRQAPNVKNLPAIHSYNELRDAVKATLMRGLERMEGERIRTYWEVGRLINKFLLDADGRAEFGKRVVLRLARDLKMSRTALYQAVRFAKIYPIVHLGGQLTWSHYRALVAVEGKKERKGLEEQVTKFGWTKEDLESHIKSVHLEKRDASEHRQKVLPLLEAPELGNLYTFRVVGAEKINPDEGSLWLDLGFTNYRKLSAEESKGLSAGDIVTALEEGSGAYRFQKIAPRDAREQNKNSGNSFVILSPPRKRGSNRLDSRLRAAWPSGGRPLSAAVPYGRYGGNDKSVNEISSADSGLLYTYKAYIERVVDGDTLRVQIDLGFGHRIRQYLRLRGIDAPEIRTPRGRRAKKFVERKLKVGAHGRAPEGRRADSRLPLLTIRSYRSDKYDRYLADVFYGEDRYLNQELLNAAFADRA